MYYVFRGIAIVSILLFSVTAVIGGNPPSVKRIGGGGDGCSEDNLMIYQNPSDRLPSGIPTYQVFIENVCMAVTGICNISNIHLKCGWFSSARLIPPEIFRRVAYDDCLVNDGNPINAGQVVTFQYANTYKYPMDILSISCN